MQSNQAKESVDDIQLLLVSFDIDFDVKDQIDFTHSLREVW